MNIVIANQYSELIKQLNISENIYTGLYDVNEVGNSMNKIQFDTLIIDVTAIKNYQYISTIKQLTNYIDASKIIILLDNNCINDEYINGLVSIGIYNFAKDTDGLLKLLNDPHTYNDVSGYRNEYNKDTLPINNEKRHAKVIGLVNVTRHAGSTTLAYSLVKILKKKYNVIGIEVDATDFSFFKSKNLISTISNKIKYLVNKYDDQDIIIIDTNDSNKAIQECDQVLYLVEPTTIKINKLMLSKPTIFRDLFDKKVVLNKCFLNKWDIAEFENESRLKIFYSMPSINERDKTDPNVIKLLAKLGIKI